ncbi:TfuA-related McrA-glycine thioamidation protein [Methanosalsum natronophilum]|uniref:TfuA-related McrA-glycine thioamidation protein n=1 Tax=Methanosalsum natronophilum TaxID=768733 RepID=A0A3R7XUZ9_9EURY|nr:MAG: TfuA-related McrA-glycine thioamidation protein [Methanosalsum natronophilum]
MNYSTTPNSIIFTGTSISHSEASRILDVQYAGPVVRCDVQKAVSEGYDIIGIIDGVFFNKAAVSHREIIKAIRNGVTVVGGGSMGALRASELDSHGMIGIGRIYEWYRDGMLEDDDEVAVATNPDTYEPVSSPMVNIRETLISAHSNRVIGKDVRDDLIDIGKRTHYNYRSYEGIIKSGLSQQIISEEEGKNLLNFCKEHEVDVKREDAKEVISKVKELMMSLTE